MIRIAPKLQIKTGPAEQGNLFRARNSLAGVYFLFVFLPTGVPPEQMESDYRTVCAVLLREQTPMVMPEPAQHRRQEEPTPTAMLELDHCHRIHLLLGVQQLGRGEIF